MPQLTKLQTTQSTKLHQNSKTNIDQQQTRQTLGNFP